MEVRILNQQGQETGRTAQLNDEIFGITPNDHAMYLDVKQYLANQRQGTHKSKQRAEIARTTKKLHKQNGSMKSPLYRGGGRVFGPIPHEYGFKLNKKLKLVARKSALSQLAASNQILVLDQIAMTAPKTKDYGVILKALGLEGKKSTVVLAEPNNSVYLSSRNFEGSKVVIASELSTYSILNGGTLVLLEPSIAKIETALTAK